MCPDFRRRELFENDSTGSTTIGYIITRGADCRFARLVAFPIRADDYPHDPATWVDVSVDTRKIVGENRGRRPEKLCGQVRDPDYGLGIAVELAKGGPDVCF